MRVAIVGLFPVDPARIAGGQRAAVYNLVQALARFADLDIHVVYCHDDAPADRVEEQGGATVHYLALRRQRPWPNYVRSLFRVAAALRDIRPDIVHAHTSHFAVPALRAGLPTLLTLHGASHREYEIYNARLYDRLRYGLATLYDRYTLPRVKDIVAISPYIMREYAGRTQARWHRIDNPLPDVWFDVARAEEPRRLLYAGTITPLKDLLTLLRALARLAGEMPDVRLRLAGRVADAAYEAELRRFVSDNALSDNVEFTGLLDPDALRREYARCALVVLPSRQEVLPMTVIEAMAVGAPVAATRAGGLPDIIEHERNGLLVNVGDDAALAAAIRRLLRDDTLRRRLAAAGRAVAEERFRAAAVAAQYRQLYMAIAGDGRRS